MKAASRGPWTVGEVLDTRTFDGDAVNVVLVRRGGHTDIAYVAYMATDGDTAEQHANARLIAAAPDLLAGAKAMLAARDAHASIAAVNALRDAIAKAEGRS